MSHTSRRLVAAALAGVVLTGPLALAQSAEAAPKAGHSSKPGKPAKADKPAKTAKPAKGPSAQTKQLAKDIAVRDAQLARVASSARTVALPDDLETVVVANVEADRAALAGLAGAADVRAARAAVQAVRVDTYSNVLGVLEEAVELLPAAAEDPEAAVLVQSAIDTALAVTATSPKSELRVAREALAAAQAELDAAPVV